MPKETANCPECGAEIDSLQYEETGLMNLENGEFLKDDCSADFKTTCPECGAQVSPDEIEQARKIK